MRNKNHHMRVLKHYGNLHGCYDLLQSAERETSAKFDWVIFVRADIAFYGGIAPFCLWDPEHVYLPPGPTYGTKVWTGRETNEPVMLIPRRYAESVLRMPAEIFSNATPGRNSPCAGTNSGVPEIFMPYIFRQNAVPIRFAAIPGVIVRENATSAGQCANWGSLMHVIGYLDPRCTRYLY